MTPHLLTFVPYHPGSHMAYIPSHPNLWKTYEPCQQGPARRTPTLAPLGISLTLPSPMSYARIHHWSGNNLVLSGHSPLQAGRTSQSPDWALSHTKSPRDSSQLVEAIQSSTTIGLSNGSYMPHCYPNLATAAWFLAGPMAAMDSLFYKASPVCSPPLVINAYRAELQQIHNSLVAIEFICNQFSITDGGVTVGCDNQGALAQSQWYTEHVPRATAHADLIQAITALRLRSKVQLTFVYVPSHQDALECFEQLSPLACLNVWADHLAKQELHHVTSMPFPPTFPDILMGEQWAAHLPSGKFTTNPHTPISKYLGRQVAKRYWAHKQQLDDHLFSLVHWDMLETAVLDFPPTFQMWLSKFASGHSAVATTMVCWKRWDSNLCPVCHAAPETTPHVLCC